MSTATRGVLLRGALGILVLVATLAYDVWNALTVLDRATFDVLGAEAFAAPTYRRASWVAAAACVAVLLALGYRVWRHAPPRWALWLVGAGAVLASWVVLLGTTTMWV